MLDIIIISAEASKILTRRDRTQAFYSWRSGHNRPSHEIGAVYCKLRHIATQSELQVLPQWTRALGVHGLHGDELLHQLGNTEAAAAKQAVEWTNGDLIAACQSCQCAFGPLARKHHCRLCGGVRCDACLTSHAAPDDGFTLISCAGCYESLMRWIRWRDGKASRVREAKLSPLAATAPNLSASMKGARHLVLLYAEEVERLQRVFSRRGSSSSSGAAAAGGGGGGATWRGEELAVWRGEELAVRLVADAMATQAQVESALRYLRSAVAEMAPTAIPIARGGGGGAAAGGELLHGSSAALTLQAALQASTQLLRACTLRYHALRRALEEACVAEQRRADRQREEERASARALEEAEAAVAAMQAAARGSERLQANQRSLKMHRALNGRSSVATLEDEEWAALEEAGDAPVGIEDADEWRAIQQMRASLTARSRWRLLRLAIAATASHGRAHRRRKAQRRWRRVRLAIAATAAYDRIARSCAAAVGSSSSSSSSSSRDDGRSASAASGSHLATPSPIDLVELIGGILPDEQRIELQRATNTLEDRLSTASTAASAKWTEWLGALASSSSSSDSAAAAAALEPLASDEYTQARVIFIDLSASSLLYSAPCLRDEVPALELVRSCELQSALDELHAVLVSSAEALGLDAASELRLITDAIGSSGGGSGSSSSAHSNRAEGGAGMLHLEAASGGPTSEAEDLVVLLLRAAEQLCDRLHRLRPPPADQSRGMLFGVQEAAERLKRALEKVQSALVEEALQSLGLDLHAPARARVSIS